MKRFLLVTMVAWAGCFGGGGQACTALYAYGLSITVTDAGGTRICDATVEAVEGPYRETLSTFGGPSCTYVGAGERAGRYLVTASRMAMKSATVDVTVTKDECHVKGEERTLVLQ